MAVLPAVQLAQVGSQAGFPGDALVNFVAICLAESGGSTDAVSPTGDVGIAQINLRYHPDVTEACALDPACNARAAYRISRAGADWSPWATWHNGAAARRLDEARAAVAQLPQTRQQVGASTAGSALSSPQLLAGGLGLLALLWLLG